MAKRNGGRKTLLTHEMKTILSEAIEKGMPVNKACDLAGINQGTFYDWLRKGREGREPYAEFSKAIAGARAVCMDSMLSLINEHALDPKNWRAAAWILERQFPDDFGETLTVRVNAEVAKELGAFLNECRERLEPEAWEQVKEVAESMGAGSDDRGRVELRH